MYSFDWFWITPSESAFKLTLQMVCMHTEVWEAPLSMTKDLAPEHNSLYLRSQEYKDFGITSENNKISVHLKSTFLFRIMPLFWNIMCLMHFFTLVLPSYLPQVTDLTLSIPRAWTRLLRIFPKKGGSWACVKLNLERRGWKTEALMLEWSLVRLVFATPRMLTWFIYSQLKNSMSWLPALCKTKQSGSDLSSESLQSG